LSPHGYLSYSKVDVIGFDKAIYVLNPVAVKVLAY